MLAHLFATLLGLSSAGGLLPDHVLVKGVVVYPDGTGAKGAKVQAAAFCIPTVGLATETTTDAEGHFTLEMRRCDKTVFKAEQPDTLWLPTEVELQSNASQDTVVMRLQQGGGVRWRVFDRRSKRFVPAGIAIIRGPRNRQWKWYALSTATGETGTTVVLPEGDYFLELREFPCAGETYYAGGPKVSFSITRGTLNQRTLDVDLAAIPVQRSYNNPRSLRCHASN